MVQRLARKMFLTDCYSYSMCQHTGDTQHDNGTALGSKDGNGIALGSKNCSSTAIGSKDGNGTALGSKDGNGTEFGSKDGFWLAGIITIHVNTQRLRSTVMVQRLAPMIQCRA